MISREAKDRLIALEKIPLDQIKFYANLMVAMRPYRQEENGRSRFRASLEKKKNSFPKYLHETINKFIKEDIEEELQARSGFLEMMDRAGKPR